LFVLLTVYERLETHLSLFQTVKPHFEKIHKSALKTNFQAELAKEHKDWRSTRKLAWNSSYM